MQSLILYLYNQHVNSKDQNSHILAKQEGIKIYTIKQLQFYKSMLVRNLFTYSASNMQLKLSLKHLFGLYRMHRFEEIMRKVGLQNIFEEWVNNQMMPIQIKNIKSIPNNCPYVYIDYKEQLPKQKQEINHGQLEEVGLKKNKSKSKQKQKPKQKLPKKKSVQIHQQQQLTKCIAMINIGQLTSQLQNQILLKQLSGIFADLKVQDLKNQQKRTQMIQMYKQIKVEEYINERFNIQTLMVFNFIRKYSYIDEKELLNRTMLSAVDLRKSIAQLITEGFINFYPQNSKTMLYKSISNQRLRQKYTDHIAQTILNLHVYMRAYENMQTQGMEDQDQNGRQQKMYIILKTLSYLDQILMIFMI